MSVTGEGVGVPFTGEQIGMLRQLAEMLRMAVPPSAEGASGNTQNFERAEAEPQAGREEATLLVEAALNRSYRRVPRAANAKKNIPPERCPWTGLTRNQFYELFKQRENGQPLIKNVSLREEGESPCRAPL